MDTRELLATLPWRPPFLMVDALIECEPRVSIVTRKRVTADDPLAVCEPGARGRFPATLLLEGMSQSAALLFRLSRPEAATRALPMLGFLRASIHGTASVGESLEFEVRSSKMTADGGVFEARARVGERVVAEAELAFGTRRGDGA